MLLTRHFVSGLAVSETQGYKRPLLTKPTDRAVTNRIRSPNVGQNLASLATRYSLATLMDGQLRPTTHHNATSLCTLAPFARPRSDELALELGEAAQDREH
jgi:hypothetical protein